MGASSRKNKLKSIMAQGKEGKARARHIYEPKLKWTSNQERSMLDQNSLK